MRFLAWLIHVYSIVLIIRVVVSWVPVDPRNPAIRALDAVTEPVLAPIRKILPDTGGIDFSPLVALLLLQVLRGLLL
ncbi:MAG: YggT family protein [Myxococcota bacterium]